MKIIKEGKLPEEKKFVMKCKNCDTIFEVTEKECIKYTGYWNEETYRYDCPLCNTSVYSFKNELQSSHH